MVNDEAFIWSHTCQVPFYAFFFSFIPHCNEHIAWFWFWYMPRYELMKRQKRNISAFCSETSSKCIETFFPFSLSLFASLSILYHSNHRRAWKGVFIIPLHMCIVLFSSADKIPNGKWCCWWKECNAKKRTRTKKEWVKKKKTKSSSLFELIPVVVIIDSPAATSYLYDSSRSSNIIKYIYMH